MRSRQLLLLVPVILMAGMTILWLRYSPTPRIYSHPGSSPLHEPTDDSTVEPTRHSDLAGHPMTRLMDDAKRDFDGLRARQSQTLPEAVKEYRRRYGLHPPPNFDRWYEFAKSRNVQLIDDYDNIHHALLPFWGLEPSTIRARAREALGFDNALTGMTIRDGRCPLIQGGTNWQQNATVGMIKSFIAHLPDMDLAFNNHDEPRVMVPHDDLLRLISIAKGVNIPKANTDEKPANEFSSRPADLNDGMTLPEFDITRFDRYAHQPVWLPSRLSCPPDSPARSLNDNPQDDTTSYSIGELGFISNVTAFSDVCLTPSLRGSFGFFDRPNAFDVVYDLFPIFSQSKVSSFQDILYPSPWYWYGKVNYEEDKDIDWEQKADQMYWRGSTTGGFSRDGGWKRQHRQRTVGRINELDTAKILEKTETGQPGDGKWRVKEVPRQDYERLFDVKFSHVGQCDPNDCEEQKKAFEIADPAGQQDAWQSKYLLDMDGNAFSGRFYAFLRSKSLVYKLALFQEWHHDWLKPWLHYIPLSLRGDEYVESVRYFAQEVEGQERGSQLALQGSDWARQALRNEDLEAWLFRLLLE